MAEAQRGKFFHKVNITMLSTYYIEDKHFFVKSFLFALYIAMNDTCRVESTRKRELMDKHTVLDCITFFLLNFNRGHDTLTLFYEIHLLH